MTGPRWTTRTIADLTADDGCNVWGGDLTDKQLLMLIASTPSCYGVELRGGNWATARSLVAKGLGSIEGGAPNGSELPGFFFGNDEAVRILREHDEEDDDGVCFACGGPLTCACPELAAAGLVGA